MDLTETPLAAARAFLDRPAVITQAQVWTWRDVHRAAAGLATRLQAGGVVCNLCDSRIGFLVAWLAAFRAGCTQILPPSAGRNELIAILKAQSPATVVVDSVASEASWAPDAPCMRWDGVLPTFGPADADLAWLRPEALDAALARLYTSGSTGTPEPQTKTLSQLARGAAVLASRLEEVLAKPVQSLGPIVCSVPPQHMFGLETSVMLPLVTGLAVRDGKPLLPADVHAAFAQGAALGSLWVATPLHLRALASSETTIPACGMVLASTMPLAPELAAQVEALCAAPVLEIYGSTETGVIAMRRPASQSFWRAVDGVTLECGEEGTRVWGSHFRSPQWLADQVNGDRDAFELLGRRGDLIKIGGRRASLASLNRVLEAMPGLSNGVFHLPVSNVSKVSNVATQRLVLFHEGAPLDRATVREWLRTRIDPVFLPRDIIRVDCLPRTATGKLQRPALDDLYAAHQRAGKAA